MKNYFGIFNSPIGLIKVTADFKSIINVDFIKEYEDENRNLLVDECISQLKEYFLGVRKRFDINISIEGSEFEKSVWQRMIKIPYGETRTYLDIAKEIKNDKASRAVGGAAHRNKIAIIIPCHRVVGTNKNLTGYAGGIEKKLWLLKHENINYK